MVQYKKIVDSVNNVTIYERITDNVTIPTDLGNKDYTKLQSDINTYGLNNVIIN